MQDQNAPTIILVCVVHQSPANTKQFIVPKPIDTMAQWRLVKINDKLVIVQQSQALSFDKFYGNARVKWTDIPPTELLRVISSQKFQIYTGFLAGLLAERKQELMRILLTTF